MRNWESSGKPAPITGKNIFHREFLQKSLFLGTGNLPVLRLKIEHSAYMLTALIVYVEILRNFDCFFNGGFS